MKQIILALSLLILCSFTNKTDSKFVDKALQYCSNQINRTLKELKADSVIDYTLMPRNILDGQSKWNCLKATKEEWTAGFWPGILWYYY